MTPSLNPFANPYQVTNYANPLDVFKLPPNVIKQIQEAAKTIITNNTTINNAAAAAGKAPAAPSVPAPPPVSRAPIPAPPAPAPPSPPPPAAPGTPSVGTGVSYPGGVQDPTNDPGVNPAPPTSGPGTGTGTQPGNEPPGTANSGVTGYQDPITGQPWGGGQPPVELPTGGSGTTLDPGNQYPPGVPIDPNVPIQNPPEGYPGAGEGGGETSHDPSLSEDAYGGYWATDGSSFQWQSGAPTDMGGGGGSENSNVDNYDYFGDGF